MNTDSPVVGRLAPTPSGHLHVGNVLAFAAAWLSVRAAHGELLLRIEDIDTTRAKKHIEDSQKQDLEWLGITWDKEVPAQQSREYISFLKQLEPNLYHCQCTRAQIKLSGGVYDGTCRDQAHHEGALRYRLHSAPVSFKDRQFGTRTVHPNTFGDPVLKRRDGVISYNLAVVADDIRDGVTEVVRGADLLDYTAVQVQLYTHLSAAAPTWTHTPIIIGPNYKKLSKSQGSVHIAEMRRVGWSPRDVWHLVLPWLGLPAMDSLEEAASEFRIGEALTGPIVLHLNANSILCPKNGVHWTLHTGDE